MNIELIEPETATEPQDIAEIRDGAAVVKLNRTEAGLLQLRTELAGKVYDLTTVKGDKEARNDRLRCVGLRANVEKLRKSLKAPALEFGRLIDSEAQRIAAAEQRQQAAAEAAAQAQAAQVTEPQPPQQVLKATPATADATDRGIAAIVSPGVGPMGAGQPADAGPTGGNVGRLQPAANEPATLTLGMICERLQFTVRADFLADVLHVSPARVEGKRPGTYTESQFQTICSQLQSHISAMGELYSPEKAA